jgi:hypothetical protein
MFEINLDLYLIIFIIFITYGINYILPILYAQNCRNIFTFNSPSCLSILSIISGNAYIHLNIFYTVTLYLGAKILKYIKNNILNKKNKQDYSNSGFTVQDITN